MTTRADASALAAAARGESAARSQGGRRRVRVLLPLPLGDAYDYAVPEDMALAPGDYVRVPLRRRLMAGVVWGEGGGGVADAKLREVSARCDAPPMPETHRRFLAWVAAWCCAPPGAALKMAIPTPDALDPPPPRLLWRAADAIPPGLRLTPTRRAVLEAAIHPGAATDLALRAGCSPGVPRDLIAAGALVAVEAPPEPAFDAPDLDRPGPALSPDQGAAAEDLRAKATQGGFSVTLLDGVTGSGKTEVYLEAAAAALRAGRQVLILLPEIALGPQSLARVERRFGARPALWHSEVSDAKRRQTWRAAATGEARVVVGARSALFLPFADLGLIVVDEEHEQAFKQEDGVAYHGRDMAVARAHAEKIPIVLASATPSLETLANVEQGRYERLVLPARHGGAVLPDVTLVDLRRDKPPRGGFLAPILRAALAETLEAGEQAMLFLNRRGYAPLTLCRVCGHRFQCPDCTAWLVEHRNPRRLVCHHCGRQEPPPPACPTCGEADALVACGPGVERVAEEAQAAFPTARVAVAASDLLPGPAAAEALFARVDRGEIDILVGTQILAKGHHFPMLTLIGVVDADLGLSGGDLRAGERTFQLLHQVAGRAGRAERPGRVFLQTYMPEHPVMQALAAHDRDAFLEAEAREREAASMPPYGRLAALILSGPHAEEVDRTARDLARRAPHGRALILGPAPAPLAVLRGRHRRRFLVKAPKDMLVQPLLREWLGGVAIPAGVRLQIDVDPYGFM